MEHIRKYIAEFIGTAILVLCGCGVAAMSGCNGDPNPSYLLTALAFGGSLVAVTCCIGSISGCHINPAVSLGMLINGRIGRKDFAGYVIAQLAGGIAGAALLGCLAGFECGFGANRLFREEIGTSFLAEVILSFIFVLAVLGVFSKTESTALSGLVTGGSLSLVHLVGIPFTGTGVNPARSLGAAIFAGEDALCCVWVFILAPLTGAAIAGFVWKFLSPAKKEGGHCGKGKTVAVRTADFTGESQRFESRGMPHHVQ